jgi:hypothetical protein
MDLALAHILGSEDGIGLLEDIHGEAAGVRDDPSVVPVPLAADDDDDDDDAIDDRHSLIPSFEGFDD